MYGTSSEFDAIKDDASIPIGSAYDITDDYEESSSGKSEKIGEYSSAQTITVDLSKYKSIGFGGVTSGYVTNIVNIPMDIFMSDTTVAYQNYYQAGSVGTQYYVSIKYVDLNHIQITRIGGFTKALIFGVM